MDTQGDCKGRGKRMNRLRHPFPICSLLILSANIAPCGHVTMFARKPRSFFGDDARESERNPDAVRLYP